MKFIRLCFVTFILTLLSTIPVFAATGTYKYQIFTNGNESTYATGTYTTYSTYVTLQEGDMSVNVNCNDTAIGIGADSHYFRSMKIQGSDSAALITGNRLRDANGATILLYEKMQIIYKSSETGGSTADQQRLVGLEETIPLDLTATKEGFDFKGWFIQDSQKKFGSFSYDSEGILTSAKFPTSSIKLYAVFEKDAVVTYHSSTGVVGTADIRWTNASPYVKIDSLRCSDMGDWKFWGWSSNEDSTSNMFPYGTDINVPVGCTDVYAVYSNTRHMHYDTLDDRYPVAEETKTIYYINGNYVDTGMTLHAGVTPPGKTFVNWIDSDKHTYNAGYSHEDYNDTYLHAQYTINNDVVVTVHHYLRKLGKAHNEVIDNYTLADTDVIAILPETTISPASHPYAGFQLEETLSSNSGGNGSVLNYFYDRVDYSVNISPQDKVGDVTGEGVYEYDTPVTIKYTPLPEYKFVKWVVDGVDVTDNPYQFNMPNDDVYIELVTDHTKYKVTYDLNGGDLITGEDNYDQTVGDQIDLSKVASRNGYTFMGWTDKVNSQKVLDNMLMPERDVTLYAVWKEHPDEYTYRVVYYLGDTVYRIDEKEASIGDVITESPLDFEGMTTTDKPVKLTIEKDLTIDFQYTPNQYTVNLEANTGNIRGNYIAKGQTNEDYAHVPKDMFTELKGGGTYNFNEPVTISAEVADGYTWNGYTGTYNREDKTFTFNMPAHDVDVNANAFKSIKVIEVSGNTVSFNTTQATGYTVDMYGNNTAKIWHNTDIEQFPYGKTTVSINIGTENITDYRQDVYRNSLIVFNSSDTKSQTTKKVISGKTLPMMAMTKGLGYRDKLVTTYGYDQSTGGTLESIFNSDGTSKEYTTVNGDYRVVDNTHADKSVILNTIGKTHNTGDTTYTSTLSINKITIFYGEQTK